MKKVILISILSSMLFSCGGAKDSDKIGNAQLCLDKISSTSSSADVDTCVAMVDGLTSTASENIRCNGGFIREGFLGSRLVAALSSISNGAGGSSVQQLMGMLSFTSSNNLVKDTANSLAIFNNCMNAGAKGATLLASFSYFTMSLVTYLNTKAVADGLAVDCPGTETAPAGYNIYDLSACATNAAAHDALLALGPLVLSGSADAAATTAQSGIGTILIATYQIACTGAGANKDLCTLLGNAVTTGGTSNPRAVAVAFFSGSLGL